VVLEVILVEIVVMINEVIKKIAMDIGKFWFMEYLEIECIINMALDGD